MSHAEGFNDNRFSFSSTDRFVTGHVRARNVREQGTNASESISHAIADHDLAVELHVLPALELAAITEARYDLNELTQK